VLLFEDAMPSARWKMSVVAACGAMLLGSPREAQASDSDFSIGREVTRANPTFLIPIVLDVGFSVYDVTTLISDERGNQVLAIAETAVALPQFLFATVLLVKNIQSPSSVEPGLFALWTGALVTHGTIVLVMGRPDEAPNPGDGPSVPKQDHPRIGVMPTMFGDGARSALVPGVIAVGTF
jgi:hypothetical protein